MKKLAFIVGMSDYPGDSLLNPGNDADSIQLAFDNLGIDTIKKVNIGIADLKDGLDDYKGKLSKYEVAIFFFAGHGMQIEGENYLCTIDTDFDTLTRIQYSSLSVSYLISLLEQTDVYTKIIILDACRDNPFERKLRGANIVNLAPVFAPLGTIIAFATSPGQTASDGRNGNGAFTYSLLQHIYTNDLKIEDLFKRSRNTLYTLTSKKQLSWEHTSLMGDFYFSTSTLTGEMNSNYSPDALADSKFNYAPTNPIVQLITALRSHDWDSQNPAIRRINSLDLEKATKEELFVLGRNIYQSGVGPAFNAADYLNNLHSNIQHFSDEVRYHILCGIIFEIYFDSEGKLRDEFKADQIDKVYGIALTPEYHNILSFIKSKLHDYPFRLLFNPLAIDNLILNIGCEIYKDDIYRITEIMAGGVNVLYNYDGTSEYVADDNIMLYEKKRLQQMIIKKIGIPSFKLSIYYPSIPDSAERLGVPYDFKLLNYPIKSTAT